MRTKAAIKQKCIIATKHGCRYRPKAGKYMQQNTNWHRENNYAGNNLAWHAASATGSRTYMGHHNTGVLTSYTEGGKFVTKFAIKRITVQTHLFTFTEQ